MFKLQRNGKTERISHQQFYDFKIQIGARRKVQWYMLNRHIIVLYVV